MTPLAPIISEFFRAYLPVQRGFSEHTCSTYAYAFKIFLAFCSSKLKTAPSNLNLEQLDSMMVMSFLKDIESSRNNSPSTRNSRLAAIKAFMRYVEFKIPGSVEQTRQILAIPSKRHETPLVKHLSLDEIQQILNTPDLSSRNGIRDRAMINLCFSCGLRVSELINLRLVDLNLRGSATIKVVGKGRRERIIPLWSDATTDLKKWIAVRENIENPEVFLNSRGEPIGRAGFEYILNKYVKLASRKQASLGGSKVSPHQLRHSCAIMMLQATKDIRKVSLWLGHADIKTTEIYLRVDPSEKLEAIEAVIPPKLKRGKFTAPDKLIASLMS
jgi:site-specific recombinase XerD